MRRDSLGSYRILTHMAWCSAYAGTCEKMAAFSARPGQALAERARDLRLREEVAELAQRTLPVVGRGKPGERH